MTTNKKFQPDHINYKTKPRRSTRNRVAKKRPGFVDPFSLGKKRKNNLGEDVYSPISISEVESTSKDTSQTKECQTINAASDIPHLILPVKKREEFRVIHRKTVRLSPGKTLQKKKPTNKTSTTRLTKS